MAKTRIVKLTGVLIFSVVVATVVLLSLTKSNVTVYVAKTDIPVGVKVTSEMMEKKTIHKDGKEPDVITTVKDMEDDKGVLDAFATMDIKSGSQLTLSKLSTPKSSNGINAQIKEGEVGIMIPVDEVSGFSKSLKVGDLITILATIPVQQTNGLIGNATDNNEIKDTIVLAENVPISNIEKDAKNEKIVGYQVILAGQTAKDLSHILSTEDAKNKKSTVRVLLSGFNNPKGAIPKKPIGELETRYTKQ